MSLNPDHLNNPILPWHREAAKAIHETPYDVEAIRQGDNGETTTASIIAAHDPHAAQHQELVNLVKSLCLRCDQVTAYPHVQSAQSVFAERVLSLAHTVQQARAHLAKLRGEGTQ